MLLKLSHGGREGCRRGCAYHPGITCPLMYDMSTLLSEVFRSAAMTASP